jgi:N-acetylmuramic acid 6-phosphate etherase
VLDAAEMGPTFGAAGLFKAVIAGGERAVTKPSEGAEDDEEAGRKEALSVGPSDFALGVSASGATRFVLAFLREAKGRGASSWLLSMSEGDGPEFLDGVIRIPTGPEIVAGSTRMKAGTATKMALNMFSTALMIKAGRVYDGLMVDVAPTNNKLLRRAVGIVMDLAGASEEEAASLLRESGMNAKTAVVMKKAGVAAEEARRMLRKKTLKDILSKGGN